MNVGLRCLYEILISIPLYIYSELKLMYHVVFLFLIFWGTYTLFSIVAAPVYIPTNRTQVFLFLYTITSLFPVLKISHI